MIPISRNSLRDKSCITDRRIIGDNATARPYLKMIGNQLRRNAETIETTANRKEATIVRKRL